MRKIILQDDSSICSVCFEELESGTEVYVDEDNDIICKDCADEE